MALFTCNFISNVLLCNTDIKVYVPSFTMTEALMNHDDGENGTDLSEKSAYPDKIKRHYRSMEKYPVVYLLNGGGKDADSWFQLTRAAMYAEEHNIALVAINSGTTPVSDQENLPLIATFLTQEVRDFVCGMFPILDEPEHSYVAGVSMGGFGTLATLITHPDLFAAGGAISPVCTMDFAMRGTRTPYINDGKYDLIKVATDYVAKGGKMPPLYLASGEKDFLYPDIIEFKKNYGQLNQPVTWENDPEAEHEWRFFDRQLEAFLNWIPRTDFYAGKRKVF